MLMAQERRCHHPRRRYDLDDRYLRSRTASVTASFPLGIATVVGEFYDPQYGMICVGNSGFFFLPTPA
jgi:hypothetical protein